MTRDEKRKIDRKKQKKKKKRTEKQQPRWRKSKNGLKGGKKNYQKKKYDLLIYTLEGKVQVAQFFFCFFFGDESWREKLNMSLERCALYFSTHIYNKYPTYTQHIMFNITRKKKTEKQQKNTRLYVRNAFFYTESRYFTLRKLYVMNVASWRGYLAENFERKSSQKIAIFLLLFFIN